MKILLDTHIFIWCLEGSPRITKNIAEQLNNTETIYISSISITEMAIKIQNGKLKLNLTKAVNSIKELGFKELAFSISHALTLKDLPLIHKDPFDRMLIAQAMSEPLKFLTADSIIKNYSELVQII